MLPIYSADQISDFGSRISKSHLQKQSKQGDKILPKVKNVQLLALIPISWSLRIPKTLTSKHICFKTIFCEVESLNWNVAFKLKHYSSAYHTIIKMALLQLLNFGKIGTILRNGNQYGELYLFHFWKDPVTLKVSSYKVTPWIFCHATTKKWSCLTLY